MIDIVLLFKRLYNKIYMSYYKKKFGSCGKNVFFSPLDSVFFYKNMYLGNDVHIAYHVVGRFVDTIGDDEKLFENDQDVIIEGDNWIGMNTTILKGVTIGRGCIVAAGAVVNKSTQPYSIVGGVPAKILRMRFTEEQIKEHERILYGKE